MPLNPHHCLICEDTRREVGNKTSIMGFYGLAPEVEIAVPRLGGKIERLTFFLLCTPQHSEELAVDGRVVDPDGKALIELPSLALPKGAGKLQLSLQVANLVVAKVGRYTLVLRENGNDTFRATFDITERPRAGLQPTAEVS